MELTTCETCGGTRLRKESLWFRVGEKNIAELSAMNLNRLAEWFAGVEKKLSTKQNIIAKDILKEIRERLQFLLDVGLTYLTLDRPSRTLKRRRIPANPARHPDRLAAPGDHLYP